ncbi:Predicted DNA-binding protein, MmcQ/YjbR family [Pseudarcicella hirudinis]|uniref:Predicted DNA-binding protein, MmcQ/YjbR family n=1 Tax=Pseudarcicella hirudinis TaxID=1079859 RepID=A0A1I5NV28_9BACT|nr:Predicted DNA-binding protein, MmcQ/YjbR family [Pseudarcicella hirudinis]
MSFQPAMNLELLREICLALPFATEDVKYGSDLCFSVGNKIFCGTRIEGPFRTGLKCDENDFIELTERSGIVPMPRLSATFWVRIEDDTVLTVKEWEYYIRKSYEQILTRLPMKTKKSLGIIDE